MSEIITVGLDLAKNVFQLHGADVSGRAVLRRKLRRGQVLEVPALSHDDCAIPLFALLRSDVPRPMTSLRPPRPEPCRRHLGP